MEDIADDWGLESTSESLYQVESKPQTILTLPWSQLPQRTEGRLRKTRQNSPAEPCFKNTAQVQIAKVERVENGVFWTPQKLDGARIRRGVRRTPLLMITWEKPTPPPL